MYSCNQSVEGADVAFVKGASVTNKINKQAIICDEQAWTNKAKDEQAQRRTDFWTNTVKC